MIDMEPSVKDTFVLFFAKPLALPEGSLTIRGYASRYSRIDVYARTIITAKHVLPDSCIEIVAVIPLLGSSEKAVLRAETCGCGHGEEALVRDILYSIKAGKSGCIQRIQIPIERLLHMYSKSKLVLSLEEGGRDISLFASRRRSIVWLMGAHLDPPEWAKELIRAYSKGRVSIGPKSYLSSHVVAYTLWARTRSSTL